MSSISKCEKLEGIKSETKKRDFNSAVLSTASALVVVLDRQGRIVRFNRACEKLTGYLFTEVEGNRFWDLFLYPTEMDDDNSGKYGSPVYLIVQRPELL
jgi:PAS domain-containing protein